jgi:tetratricopeptide (TPR) repeat protein
VWRRRHADELTPTIDAATPPLSPAAVRTDEATVLVGLLRAAGIPAHVALHRDQLFQADGSPAFPGLRQFTATIVVVPGPEPLWIEPVGDNTPPGRISHGDLGRLALIAAPETTSLVRLPFPRPEDNTYRETRAITLAAYGRARARTEISTTGYHEDFVRDDWVYGHKNDPTQWTLTRRFARHNLRSIEVSPADDILVPLRAVVDADTTDETRTDLDSARVALDWHTLIDLPGPWADPRQNPHTVTPYDNSLTYRVTLPPGFTAQIPAFNPPDLAPLQVERTVAHDGDTLVVTLHARLAVDRVSVEQYDRLHREVPRLAAEHGHILAIHDARLARERGDLRAAHTLVARDAADPNSGTIARLRLADQLRRVHLHARALAEVRAVIAAEPDHALAHAMLADLLRTDRLGRARRSGWDRSGAMAASLRAAELDETRIRARLDAADDAETGDDGALYGPGSDLARAAELRAAIRTYELERLADPAPIVRELELLWHLGRLDELADRLKYMHDPPRIGRRMLAWRAHGVPGLLADLDADRTTSSAGRAIDLRAMVDLLLELESYADLTPLIDALPQPDITADVDLRRRHRAALQAAPRAAAATPPQQLVLRLVDAVVTNPAALPALLSTRVDDPARVLADLSRRWPLNDRTALSPAHLRHRRDVAVGSLTFTSEGDDDLGHRIHAPPHTFYVVREGADYRLRATSRQLPELLHEAAARLAAGDVAGGRQWLAWRYEGAWRSTAHVLTQPPDDLLWLEDRVDPAVIVQAGLAMLGEPNALTKLLAARAALTDDDPIAIHLDHAIVRAAERPADAARALARLRVRFAGADALTLLEIHHASRTHAWQRRDRLTGRHLADHPNDDDIRRAWARELARRGRPARAIDLLLALHTAERATASDLNNMAWWSLFVGDGVPDPRALTWATRAADTREPARLHTLACVHAAMGRTADALATFDELLRQRDEPAPEDAFILAEIHRQLGYTAEADAAYTAIAGHDPDETTSTAALARRRLARR